MKKLFTMLAAVLSTAGAYAQSPQKMSFQAIIRDANNTLVISTKVGIKISLLKGSFNGPAVYIETQTPITNINGLATMEMGNGTVVSGNFASIDWSSGPYFIKTETDPTGGTSYNITGTSELLSVPFALHAKTAENISAETDPIFAVSVAAEITGADTTKWNNKQESFAETDSIFGASVAAGITEADTINWNNKQNILTAGAGIEIAGNVIRAIGFPGPFYIGQDTLGGIVYYLYIGGDGKQHGLIVSKTESIEQWQSTSSLVNADRTEDGTYNTGLMTNSPAATYAANLGAGWYLPAIDELLLLYNNLVIVNKALRAGGFILLANTDAKYWSSTELAFDPNFNAWIAYSLNLGTGERVVLFEKTNSYRVRGVRAF